MLNKTVAITYSIKGSVEFNKGFFCWVATADVYGFLDYYANIINIE